MERERVDSKARLGRWLRAHLVPQAYESHVFFGALFERVSKAMRLEELLRMVSTALAAHLELSSMTIFLSRGGDFEVAHALGTLDVADVCFSTRSSMVTHLRRSSRPTVLDKGFFDPWRMLSTQEEAAALERLRAQLLLPFVGRGGLVGFAAITRSGVRDFTRYELRLLRLLGRQVGLALEAALTLEALSTEAARRERVTRELELARAVQERLLPQASPILPGLTIAGRCISALEVGGDYYDMLVLENGDLCFALGDVSGKGISSALLMATLRASLRTLLLDERTSPTELVRKLNKLIHEASADNRFATFVLFFYDLATHQLTYVNAGHNAPLVFSGNSVRRLECGGPVLGLFGEWIYEQETLAIEPGDLLVVYSDGVNESVDPGGAEWCEEGLLAALEDQRAAGTQGGAAGVVDGVFAALERFVRQTPQPDDITLLVFERCLQS